MRFAITMSAMLAVASANDYEASMQHKERMLMQRKLQQAPAKWKGLNLWEFLSGGGELPYCGELGQEAPFQGGKNGFFGPGPLKEPCHKINICHGNAGFGWNAITVDRHSLSEDGINGHANELHNNRLNKRPDYLPYSTAVPNPYGAGKNNGYLDGNCNFVCEGDNCGDEPELKAIPTPQICVDFQLEEELDGTPLDVNVPKPEKCVMKRSGEALRWSPNFPLQRPDVYIEVLLPSTGEIITFSPHDTTIYPNGPGSDAKQGEIPLPAISPEYQKMFDEQEKLGGMGFQLRFVGKNGPGEWNSCKYSPIAFDLNGSGAVETVTSSKGFKIDITGDGEDEHIARWFAPTEGILIDTHDDPNLKDVSGVNMLGDMAGQYADGFAKLATYDTDCDGKICYEEMDGLYIWIDENSNTVLDKGELHTLDEYGIVCLDTIHDDLKATAIKEDGSTILMQDLWFNAFEPERKAKKAKKDKKKAEKKVEKKKKDKKVKWDKKKAWEAKPKGGFKKGEWKEMLRDWVKPNKVKKNAGDKGRTDVVKRTRKDRKKEKPAESGLDITGGRCVADHKCATWRGDPHFTTYDGLKFDCQGHGEFVMAKSMTTAFEVQSRFHSINKADGKTVSITTAVSIDPGVEGAPQLDVFVHELNGECILNYFVDGLPANFGAEGKDVLGIEFIPDFNVGKEIVDYVYFTGSGVMFTTLARKGSFGCVMDSKLCLPPKMVQEEQIIGLLGSPNGNVADDWMSAYGENLHHGGNTAWDAAYDYCTREWCVHTEADSIFGYEAGTSWTDFYGCQASYDNAPQLLVENPTPECADCCSVIPDVDGYEACLLECMEGDQIDCVTEIINTEVLADVEKKCPDVVVVDPVTTTRTLDEPVTKTLPPEEPDPVDFTELEPLLETCGVKSPNVPDPTVIAAGGNPRCSDLGYAFGWKMDSCWTMGGPFSEEGGLVYEGPAKGAQACGADKTVPKGSFAVTCGDEGFATIETTCPVAVLMKSGAGGHNFYELPSAGIYTNLQTNNGLNGDKPCGPQGISHITFCFQCPAPEPEENPDPNTPPDPSVNNPPVAVDETATTPEGVPITVDVLTNDSDPDGDPIKLSFVGACEHGMMIDNLDGTVLYTPPDGFKGVDTCGYTIEDIPGGLTDEAIVTITVTHVEPPLPVEPPVAQDDPVTTEKDTPIDVEVLLNDFDVDGEEISVVSVGTCEFAGSMVKNADGTVTYTPPPGYVGNDVCPYTITDPDGMEASANVLVTIIEPHPPVAVDDAKTTSKDTPVVIPVLDNDMDPDNDPLGVVSVGACANGGMMEINEEFTLTYTPPAGYVGTDTCPYTISDPGGLQDTADVVITIEDVAPPLIPPVAVDDAVTTLKNTPVQIVVLDNDYDPEDQPVSVVSTDVCEFDGVMVKNGDGTTTYTPPKDYVGNDVCPYTITDPDGLTATANVLVTIEEPVLVPPVASDDTVETMKDTPVTVSVLDNDYDPDGQPLVVTTVGPCEFAGSMVSNGDGTVVYTPPAGYVGNDVCPYTIADPDGLSATADVLIKVKPLPLIPPVAVDDAVTTPKDTPVTIPVLDNDYDPEDQTVELVSVGQCANGDMMPNTDGTITYTPDGGYVGTDTCPYTITDPDGLTDSAVVTITIVDANPVPVTKGSGSGDPHFKTWTGEKYDYHGECDLVLVNNPKFNNGQGLRVHIRTTRVKYFSYIERVAVQIGDDVLEFDNDVENFLLNGQPAEPNQLHHKTKLGGFVVHRLKKALSIRLHDEGASSRHANTVAKIDLHTRKNGFPAVIMDGGITDTFWGSLGLLGDWETGKTLGRDGKTVIPIEDKMDATAFALEWQVRDDEPMLFKEARFPQFPQTCSPPMKHLQNRIGMEAARKQAEAACAHWEEDMDDCIFDVMATRDVLVAEEGHIVHIE